MKEESKLSQAISKNRGMGKTIAMKQLYNQIMEEEDELPKELFDKTIYRRLGAMDEIGKYYTPEIEEFHVGFEYEQVMDAVWEKCEMHLLDLGRVNGRLSSLRVKHLDREDIESLGWEAVPMEGNLWQHYEKEGDSINGLYHEVNNIQNGVWFTWWNPNNSQTHATRLFVKNKSELKRILKQIGCLD